MSGTAFRLGRTELGPLVDELVRRLSKGDAPATVSLRNLPAAARSALADLLGVDRVPTPNGRVRVDRIVSALGLVSFGELRAAVEELRGPLPDRRAARQRERADRDALWSWLGDEAAGIPLAHDPSRMGVWVEAQRVRGAQGGVEVHRRRLERALSVLGSLPADGVPLSSLAADRAGGPHALDHSTRLAAIVLDGIAVALDSARPVSAEEIRLMWETVGVAPDPHSSTVLVLGLGGGGATPLDRWLVDAAGTGEPVVLSLANLRRWPLRPLAPDARIFVVENPAIVAEAAAVGLQNAVLVCSSGRPNVAVVTLLRQLRGEGAVVYQHADFDPAGLAITAWLADRAGTTPWRMSAADYLGALDGRPDRAPVKGTVPVTPWDPDLGPAMERAGVAVYEEDIRSEILASMQS